MSVSAPSFRPRWFVAGDINGFFGLVVDNLSILGFIAMALIGIFGFPAEVVFTRMFPGTALGVLVGNVLYTVMALRLARRTGRSDVTAMPLGLDAPTSIGMALLVLGPAFLGFKAAGMEEAVAATATWQLGMASLVVMGVLKTVLSFAGDAVTRHVPRAALLGSIGGAALMLLGFLPLIESLRQPLVGVVTLGVLLYILVAGGRVPLRIPGVLFALLIGVALYYGLGMGGVLTGFVLPAGVTLSPALPLPSLGFIAGLPLTVPYLSLLLPFGLLMIVGGINVTESARAAGDDYRTRDVLLVESLSTLVAGVCGGVAQTTPYIGQPAYKRLGARTGYTLLTGLFVGIGGMLGVVAGLVQWLPVAVLAPIIVFVGLDITVQAFQSTRREHAVAVALSFLPAVAYLINIKFGVWVAPEVQAALYAAVDSHGLSDVAALQALGNGFIITAILWAASLIALIERRTAVAVGVLLLAAAFTAFGVMHSTDPRGGVYLPWAIDGLRASITWQLTGAYVVLALIVGGMASLLPSPREGNIVH